MARVSRRPASVLARRSPNRIAKRNARKHKVILESVTQEKKKLRSVISFEAKAPPGYTFIPAGNPHLTMTCKELCRKDGLKVYAVSTTRHMHTHNLSQHVHRIGYHFPSTVVATVCMDLGLYLTATGKAVPVHNMGDQTYPKSTNTEVSQITINTEARDVLKDLFPNIPDNDLNQIIKTAFQKGQRKVGTAVELPLARRAQLAVVAHIRHIYTNYDRLLKTTSFHEARSTVEEPTLAKLVEWRGDDENGKTVLEDVFREVIVISDDEDSDTEGETRPFGNRDYSVEVISSNARAEELQTRPLNYASPTLRETQVEISEDEAPPGYRFIPEAPKKTKIDRRGFSRYQAWDRAINRYRNIANDARPQPPVYSARQPLQESVGFEREPSLRRAMESRPLPAAPYTLSNLRSVNSDLNRPTLNPVVEHRQFELYPLAELPHVRTDAPPLPILAPLDRGAVLEPKGPLFHPTDSPNGPVFVSGPREIHERIEDYSRHPPRPAGPPHSRNMNPQDRALPSIEIPLPVEIKRPNSGHIEHLTKQMSGAFNFRSVTPHRQSHHEPSHQKPEDFVHDHAPKRRRMAYYEQVPLQKPRSGIDPSTLENPQGDRYAAIGLPYVQNEPHARRRYVPSAEPLYIGGRHSGSSQDPSLYTPSLNHDPQVIAHAGSITKHDGPLSSQGRLGEYRTYPRSPDQARIISHPRPAMPIGSGFDRVVSTQQLDPRNIHIYHNAHGHAVSSVRPPEVTRQQNEPTWENRAGENVLMPYKPAEKERLYADGFVRTVGLREPGVMEYPPAHRGPARHVVESPPQPVNIKFYHDQHRRAPSESILSVPPRGRGPMEPKTGSPSQHYPVVADRSPRYSNDGRLFRSPPTSHPYQRRCEDASLAPPRNPYELHQRVPWTEEQRPTYVRRVEGSRYPLSEGKTVMIVD